MITWNVASTRRTPMKVVDHLELGVSLINNIVCCSLLDELKMGRLYLTQTVMTSEYIHEDFSCCHDLPCFTRL